MKSQDAMYKEDSVSWDKDQDGVIDDDADIPEFAQIPMNALIKYLRMKSTPIEWPEKYVTRTFAALCEGGGVCDHTRCGNATALLGAGPSSSDNQSTSG